MGHPDPGPCVMQGIMNDFLCPSCLVPSRTGVAWAHTARLTLCSGHVSDDVLERFEEVQDTLVAIGQLEPGPFFSGLPERWFMGPQFWFRCGNGHVHTSCDPSGIVAGTCPECSEPIALTFPEDSGGPLRLSRA